MNKLLLSTALLLVAPAAFAWSGCGVVIDLPKGWNAEVLAEDKSACEIGARPGNWKKQVEKSRWYDDPYAIYLKVFHISFKAAGEELGFERDEIGRWGVPGRGGAPPQSSRVKIGEFAGWRSEPWFRGFAKDGVDLRGESRIYSGSRIFLLLRDQHGTVIGVVYNQRSPDIKLNRDTAADAIVRSLRPATSTTDSAPPVTQKPART